MLIEQAGRFIAVESKFTETPDSSSLKGINALKKYYGDESLVSGFIASRTKNVYKLDEKVTVIPGSRIDAVLGAIKF
jgi:hypothetical protein